MEAFFPAYLQSTSRPDPRIEVSPSVKIINNRHCRQLRIPIPPTTKRRHQHFADFHHLTSWCDLGSDILLLKYIYKSVFFVACSFCTNPGWPGTEDEPSFGSLLGVGVIISIFGYEAAWHGDRICPKIMLLVESDSVICPQYAFIFQNTTLVVSHEFRTKVYWLDGDFWTIDKTSLVQTLPKAQRTRGLSSYNKITVHSSQYWTYYNFRISIKHQLQNLNKNIKHQHLD